jgi:hypothetical protein
VLGDKRLALARCGIFSWAVEITLGDGAIGQGLRREQALREAVFGDQLVGEDPEHLSPHLANGVDTPVPRLVERLVSGGVDSVVL